MNRSHYYLMISTICIDLKYNIFCVRIQNTFCLAYNVIASVTLITRWVLKLIFQRMEIMLGLQQKAVILNHATYRYTTTFICTWCCTSEMVTTSQRALEKDERWPRLVFIRTKSLKHANWIFNIRMWIYWGLWNDWRATDAAATGWRRSLVGRDCVMEAGCHDNASMVFVITTLLVRNFSDRRAQIIKSVGQWCTVTS